MNLIKKERRRGGIDCGRRQLAEEISGDDRPCAQHQEKKGLRLGGRLSIGSDQVRKHEFKKLPPRK